MYKGISTAETVKFISKNDPDPKNPTVFHLRGLDRFILAIIEDMTTEYRAVGKGPEATVEIHINSAMRNLLVAKYGIAKIENYADPKTGKAVTIEASEERSFHDQAYHAIPDDILKYFPGSGLIGELSNEILKMNALSEEEEKN